VPLYLILERRKLIDLIYNQDRPVAVPVQARIEANYIIQLLNYLGKSGSSQKGRNLASYLLGPAPYDSKEAVTQ